MGLTSGPDLPQSNCILCQAKQEKLVHPTKSDASVLPQTNEKGKPAGRKEKTWRKGRERGRRCERMALADSPGQDCGFPFCHCVVRMDAASGNGSWTPEKTGRSNPSVSCYQRAKGSSPPHLEDDLSSQIQPPETEN